MSAEPHGLLTAAVRRRADLRVAAVQAGSV